MDARGGFGPDQPQPQPQPGQPTYSVGAPPPGYSGPPPAWQTQPYPSKRKRTAPLWVAFVTGIGGLIIGIAAGSGTKSTPAAAAATVTVTAEAGPAGATSAAPAPPATTKPAPPVDKGAMGDVVLGKMVVGGFGSVTVPVTIVNHSSKTSNYIVQFEVDNAAGVKIGDGLAATNNLAPNQKAQLNGAAMGTGDGAVAVKLTSVTRYPSV